MAAKNAATGRKTTIEIPIPSIRRYVPGSGPPPPRISLAPPHDSTAYIINQFVLPTEKDTTAASRRLIFYHIGFTDLPSVKILIPCDKVLDYVSPRELENWEYNNAEKKEEERASERVAKKLGGKAVKRKSTKKTDIRPDGIIPTASMVSPTDEALLLAEQIAGPSLSTPQKRKLGQMLEEEDTGETSHLESDDAAIQRQLQRDAESESMGIGDGMEEDSESVDQLAFHYEASGAATPFRAGSSAPLPRNPFPAVTPTDPNFLTPVAAPSAFDSSGACSPRRTHPVWAQAFGRPNEAERSVNPPSQNGHAKPNGIGAETVQKLDLTKLRERSRPLNSFASPPAAGSMAGGTGRSSREPVSAFSTPTRTAKSTPIPYSSADKGKKQKGKKQAPKMPPTGPSREKQPKKRNKKGKQEIKEEEEPAADEWEVKDLLDDRWVFENGVKVHKYLVLWEGDWPEDQNPTWEPDENVQDENLIKRYQKKKKAGLLKSPKKSQRTLHQYLSGARYASVAEAFEAGIDEQAGPDAGSRNSDAEGPDEKFLVTENAREFTSNGATPSPSFRLFDGKLARYNQSFPRA
ncbi:Chromodomain protein-2 [Madurella fahalii]|uniref:Chromodomain protein-2 n=1 Tax=Madurella fahalii TaxID=1157608 RepID=A0ABQ0FZ03_9PEZI